MQRERTVPESGVIGANADARGLAQVAGGCGVVEVSADAGAEGLSLVLWLTGTEARRHQAAGFWTRMAGADVFFAPLTEMLGRMAFKAERTLPVNDPAPRVPDAWLLRASPKMPPPSVARVTIDMLADGRLAIESISGGRPDCRYAPCTVDFALKFSLPQVLRELMPAPSAQNAAATSAGAASVAAPMPPGCIQQTEAPPETGASILQELKALREELRAWRLEGAEPLIPVPDVTHAAERAPSRSCAVPVRAPAPPGYKWVVTIGAEWLEPIEDSCPLRPWACPRQSTPADAAAAFAHPEAGSAADRSHPCQRCSSGLAPRG